MWLVEGALRRPYTVAVMAILILTMGILSLSRMVVDIFPSIDIPVVAVVWAYPGLPAEDMERRVVLISERAYSTWSSPDWASSTARAKAANARYCEGCTRCSGIERDSSIATLPGVSSAALKE